MDITNLDYSRLMSDATSQAEAKTGDNLGTAMALLVQEIQLATGGNPFKLEQLTRQLAESLRSGQGFGAALPQGNGAVNLLGASDASDDSNTEPSEAEKLGAQLLKLSKSSDDAANNIALLQRLNGTPQLGRFVVQVVEDIERGRDQLVVVGNALHLASAVTIERRRQELDTAFNDVVMAATGGAVVPGNIPQIAATAVDDIEKLRDAASPDAFNEAVEKVTSVKRTKNEEFDSYAARAILWFVESKITAAVAKETNLLRNIGEPVEDFVKRACASDNPNGIAVTKLLNEIGRAIGVERENRSNDDYKIELLRVIGLYMQNSESLHEVYGKLKEIAKANNLTVSKGEKTTDLAVRLIKHNRKFGSAMQGV